MDRKTLIFWMEQNAQPSSIIPMKLSNAEPFLVRLTGGCGHMDKPTGETSIRVLEEALSGFGGILLHGGTRILTPTPHGYQVLPTILEVPPKLRTANSTMLSFGIVPRMVHAEYSAELGLIVGRDPDTGRLTVIHPNQDICLVLQKNVDQPSFWDAERLACLEITKDFLENRRHFGAALIAFNGGDVTGREISDWANANLPVILFQDSGRITETYCHNQSWLADHPNVFVCQTAHQARTKLHQLGGLHD